MQTAHKPKKPDWRKPCGMPLEPACRTYDELQISG
jgi:hypothetical protein